MNPGINYRFIFLVLADVLHEAGAIDKEGLDQARAYLDKLPPYMKATGEDYEQWRKTEKTEDA